MIRESRLLDDDQLAEMCELREKGWSTDRIARHFTDAGSPISPAAIYWQCMKFGADVPEKLRGLCSQATRPYQRGKHVVRPYSAEEDALLRVLDMQGFRPSVMARRLGRRTNSIRGRLMTLARRDARAEDRGKPAHDGMPA